MTCCTAQLSSVISFSLVAFCDLTLTRTRSTSLSFESTSAIQSYVEFNCSLVVVVIEVIITTCFCLHPGPGLVNLKASQFDKLLCASGAKSLSLRVQVIKTGPCQWVIVTVRAHVR
jgi:hypothetical protein